VEAESFAMPVDHGSRFDQHHGVENLRPEAVEPNPEQPVGGEEPRLAVTVPPQDGHLMPQGDEFEFQRGATANPELEQGPEGGQKREHADHGMSAPSKTLCFLGFLNFEQAQAVPKEWDWERASAYSSVMFTVP